MSRLPVTLGVAAGVLTLDQVTKAIAVHALEGESAVQVVGRWLQLVLVRNPGAAFSLAGGYTVLISALAIAVTVFIIRQARTLTSTWWAVVLGGVLGGALGNLCDRLFRAPAPFQGHVVDFLALPNWPVFNVADMSLVGSAILAVLLSLRGVDLSAPPSKAAAPGPSPAAGGGHPLDAPPATSEPPGTPESPRTPEGGAHG